MECSSREWSQQFEVIKRQIQSKRAACDLKLSEVRENRRNIMKKLINDQLRTNYLINGT